MRFSNCHHRGAAPVAAILQEFVDAVGAMQLHPIEAGRAGASGGLGTLRSDGDLRW